MKEIKEWLLLKEIAKFYCKSQILNIPPSVRLYENVIKIDGKIEFFYSDKLLDIYKNTSRVCDLPGGKIITKLLDHFDKDEYEIYYLEYLPSMYRNEIKTGYVAKPFSINKYGSHANTPDEAILSTKKRIKYLVGKAIT